MEIRLLTAADAERYRNLRLQALQHSPEAFLMTYEEEASQTDSLQQYREKLQRESSYTYGIFKGAELVGIGTLQAEKPLKVRHKGNVFAMYVAQGERGGGIGKRLLQQLIQQARSLDLEQLHLTVVSANRAAKALYASFGFRRYGLEEQALKWNGQYWDEEHMVLFLKKKTPE
ncbi:GNAT family N-acetyltransferase [Bacillus badius]|uniref:GNAT family N-acetyltransferase n=1 Tax=Bacillus badius TaxID=1455 RepID=UPI001CBC7C89|nr:GNAT family N-acetyltransferase [Bacillus badius]MED0667973.1 GNAT family N-acetyltransferase [Bacillus badius]UAT33030.1 GNAT family N-acetyltransferase [Bacillus badius]